jgi:rubrerythrin
MSNLKKFEEIINFAIEREKEAVKFYHDLQNLVTFKSKKDMLHEFELMEQGHIVILENIRSQAIEEIKIPEVENLAISDFIVESKPDADMSYQDLLITAMKKEEKAQQLYSKLAHESTDGSIQKLFLKLASEEAKHKLYFEKIYDDDILKEN